MKICATKENIFTGIQIQVGLPNNQNQKYTNITTLSSVGITEPCLVRTLFGVAVNNSVSELTVFYDETLGVS